MATLVVSVKRQALDDLFDRVERRVLKYAKDVYNEETAFDSDGLDQAEHDGLLQALSILKDEVRKAKRRA